MASQDQHVVAVTRASTRRYLFLNQVKMIPEWILILLDLGVSRQGANGNQFQSDPRAEGLDPRAEGLGPCIAGLDPRILDSGNKKTELSPEMNIQFRNKLFDCYAMCPMYALHLPQDLHRSGSSGGRGGERRVC